MAESDLRVRVLAMINQSSSQPIVYGVKACQDRLALVHLTRKTIILIQVPILIVDYFTERWLRASVPSTATFSLTCRELERGGGGERLRATSSTASRTKYGNLFTCRYCLQTHSCSSL